MAPIIFALADVRSDLGCLGVGPSWQGYLPLPHTEPPPNPAYVQMPSVIIFSLFKTRVALSWKGLHPIPPTYLHVYGVTKDSGGNVLSGCTVNLFRSKDNKLIDSAVSDANGNYEFRTASLSTNYYVVAYLAGSPDVSGTTINTLQGS